jgi:hypothetical protein
VAGQEFAKRLGRSTFWGTKEVDANGHVMEATGEDYSVAVDTTSNEVLYWLENAVEKALKSSDEPFVVKTEEDAWRVAAEWSRVAQIELPPRKDLNELKDDGVVYGYTVRFADQPFGQADSGHNRVLMEINRFSGEVTTMMRVSGFRYDPPPTHRVSPAQAMANFADAVEGQLGVRPTEIHVSRTAYSSYGGKHDGSFADPKRPNLHGAKRARLVYNLRGKAVVPEGEIELSGAVDVENGMVVAGDISKSSAKSRSAVSSSAVQTQKPTPRPSPLKLKESPSEFPTVLVLSFTLVGVALGFGLFALMKR